MVLSHPQSEIDNQTTQSLSEILAEMRNHFTGWDDRLAKIISLIHTTLKWPLYSLPSISSYLHPSYKLVLIGDGAHAMLPYMSQGAAMAVEDGAALAEALHLVSTNEQVAEALRVWNGTRVQRSSQMQEASSNNGTIWHFRDGPDQAARDAGMEWEVTDDEQSTRHQVSRFVGRKSPNQWSDWKTSIWCFGYDAESEIQRNYKLLKRCIV